MPPSGPPTAGAPTSRLLASSRGLLVRYRLAVAISAPWRVRTPSEGQQRVASLLGSQTFDMCRDLWRSAFMTKCGVGFLGCAAGTSTYAEHRNFRWPALVVRVCAAVQNNSEMSYRGHVVPYAHS
ncbi:unnamed protein product [Prorocentrum cordatum]|uniref:Uncharacterized protein n=1 Tax=Prorocentrum cordatum TaxID=2364126 RepID=A0ABN9W136_9DINO|nr:unnamed protein product [Polarella glacialis]